MSKRGQVFILAAMLIAVILFSLAAVRNKSEQEQIRGDFEALSENYKIEASKLINSAVKQHGINPHEAFKSFTTMFTSYAKGKNLEYGLIYILSFEDKIQVANFLDREITVQGCGAGGAGYSVNISGGFQNISASLNFEGFNIQTGIVPADLRFDCKNVTSDSLITEPNQNANICAFIYLGETVTETDLAVMIDGAPYKSCVKKGVPEIMQVSIMRQGEQAKVSATGDCVGEDFCEGFDQAECAICGKDVCSWFDSACGGFCLSKYAYPRRFSLECPDSGNKFCFGDRIFCYDTCGNPIKIAPGAENDCESQGKVCRDKDSAPPVATQCCIKQNTKKCCGDDVCWFSSCGTWEGIADDCDDVEVCRDASYEGYNGVDPVQCCIKEDHLKCVGNEIRQFSSCGTDEGWKQTCSANTICRDSGLPPEIQEDAVCCIKDYKVNCYDDNRYYFDSCGIVGSLVEDCKGEGNTECRNASYEGYDGGDESECCKLNYEKRCYDNDVYWYSDCGTREEKFKECEDKGCESGQCKIVYE